MSDLSKIPVTVITGFLGSGKTTLIRHLMANPQKPDHILIETSGLALPKPLLKAFDWPAIRSKITVDGVVALADAEAVAAGRFAPDVDAVQAQRLADDSIDHETP